MHAQQKDHMENTVRGYLKLERGVSPKPNLLAPWSYMYNLQNCEK